MKVWLLDQNLPARLAFTPLLPAISAASLGRNPTDSQLWDHAREHELAIISKDADFSGRLILQTPPRRGLCICGSATCDSGNFMR